MPWCPNCKTEYRDGIEKCADCGSHLVKSLNEEDVVSELMMLLFGEEKQIRMIEEHLLEDGFTSVQVLKKKQEDVLPEPDSSKPDVIYELYISAEEREAAMKSTTDFMKSTTPQEIENEKRMSAVKAPKRMPPAQSYKTSEERKSELKSSGIMLLSFGVAGVVFMVLVILQVIPMKFVGFNAVIAYSVMGIFFGALLISGIMSLRSAKKMGSENDEEKKQMDELNAWCDKNLTKENIEKVIPGDVSEDEQIYFERFDYIKQALHREFPDLKDDFLEYYSELLYGKYFE